MNRRECLAAAFFPIASLPGLADAEPAVAPSAERSGPGMFAFPQGVASGDPRADSLVFWTRCVRTDGRAQPVPVTLELFEDARCQRPIVSVPLTAHARFDHTVRIKLVKMRPQTVYHYRFRAGRDVSPTGRAETAPNTHTPLQQLRFAWFTCQDWSVNHWGAMSLMAKEEFDFIVHVGDYIYETVNAAFQSGAAEPAHGPITFPDGSPLPGGARAATTLADYRTLYKTYRSDPRLQALHARQPFIATWDDHEFSDDAWQDHQTYTNANLQQTARRRAANQAWVEYMPVDFGDVAFDSTNAAYNNLRIYRDFRFGSLMHLVMTDERLYRDDHVVPEAVIAEAQGHDPINGGDSVGSRYFIQQPVLQQFEALRTQTLGRKPSILGTQQTEWFKHTLKTTNATWKCWGNEVMLNRLWLDLRTQAPAPYNARYIVNGDAWDGYPSHKAEITGFLREQQIRNVVALTGDLHAFQCGIVRDGLDQSAGTPVLVDFVCAGISSSSFYSYVKAGAGATPLAALTASPAVFDTVLKTQNPDLVYADHDAQGYASAVVTPTHLAVTFHKVRGLNADGSVPVAPLLKRTRVTLLEGSVQPLIEDNV